MSGVDNGISSRRIPSANPLLYSAMRAPSTPHSPARSRPSSTSSARSIIVYDNPAARRYAQASPATRSLAGSFQSQGRRPTQYGRPAELREQHAVNVNQLNAVQPNDLMDPFLFDQSSNNYSQSKCPAPIKKMAYGNEKPQFDDCGQELAQLAPFVSTDDCFQLEDLDLRVSNYSVTF